MLSNIISLVSGCITFLGGFVVVWGAVSLGLAIKDETRGGAQIADMHLKLSQAKDLGTGQDNVVASSNKIISQTGDNVAGVAGAAAVAAVAAGAAVVARRRMQRR